MNFKNLRRMVCVLFVLIITVIGITVSAENDSRVQTAATLEIFNEKFDMDYSMTRSEFVKMTCEFIKLGELSSFETTFSDVPVGSQNAGYIYAAAKRGIISSRGKFYPNEKITVEEAQNMIVGAIGFGVMSVNKSDIVKGIDFDNHVTYETALKMFYNAFFEDAYEVTDTNKSGGFTVKRSGKNMLGYYHSIYRKKGIVSANERTALNVGMKNVGKGYVVIGNSEYNVGITDIGNYLGQEVEFYYYYNQSEDTSTVKYFKAENSNKTVTVRSEDISDASGRSELIYSVNGKDKTLKIADDADLIYNGTAASFNEDWQVKPLDGSVTLSDTDNDGKYDVVITESYITYYVAGINADKMKIYDNYIQPQLSVGDKEYNIFRDGKKIDFKEIINDTVLYIRAEKEYVGTDGMRYVDAANSEYADIYAGSETVNGTVMTIDGDGLKMLGTEYKFSGYLKSLINNKKIDVPKAGDIIPAVFNPYGKIAAFDTKKFDSKQYGYLMTSYLSESGDGLCLKILNTRGKMERIDCALRIIIDGSGYKTASAAKNALADKNVIEYMMNGSGEVVNISMPAAEASDSYNWRNNGQCGMDMVLSSDAVIFTVPADKQGSDKKFGIVKKQNDYFKDNQYYKIEGYNLDDGLCKLAVTYGEPGKDRISANAKFFVVSDIISTIDEDDEPVLKIKGMMDRQEKEYMLAGDAEFYDFDPDAEEYYGTEFKQEELNKGDIFYFSENSDGDIKTVLRVLNVKKINEYKSVGSFLSEWGFRQGKVYSSNGNAMQIGFTDSDTVNGKSLQVWTRNEIDTFYVYDLQSKKLRIGDETDIISYKKSGDIDETSVLFLRTLWGTTKEIIIYNK